MHTLDQWRELPEIRPDMRQPYNLPCPACGESMVYPTSCSCDFEARVWALCGFEGFRQPFTRANLVAVNRAMRALDDSGSWPVRSRFNCTDRAIRRVRGYDSDSLDGYVRAVDFEIGRIVNDPATF